MAKAGGVGTYQGTAATGERGAARSPAPPAPPAPRATDTLGAPAEREEEDGGGACRESCYFQTNSGHILTSAVRFCFRRYCPNSASVPIIAKRRI